MSDKNFFNELYELNVNKFVEKKNTGKVSLSYLSWPYAWKEVKSRFPNASYEIVKFENGLPYCYDSNTGYMVYTKVTIEGITHEMWLPVMDSHNDAMLDHPYEVKTKYNSYTVGKCTMFDVNKTIMRCLTKNLAMFGLGLYIYAGEDLPNIEAAENIKDQQTAQSEEIANLKNALLDYINTGILSGAGADKANAYMTNGDIPGMRRTLDWCKSQEKTV